MAGSQETLNALVGRLRQFKSSGASREKPALWLGAGCSVFDGVPLTVDLLPNVLANQPAGWGSPQFRFDEMLDQFGPGPAREQILTPYFKRPLRPDSPYREVVRLLREGYLDLVCTFNIDTLLEQALEAAGMREGDSPDRDYCLIKAPMLLPEAVVIQAERALPRIKVVKLHGDFQLGINYMTSSEIIQYEHTTADLVRKLSGQPALVCGYSFYHLNVLTAFSRKGGPLFYVNRSFPDAPMVLSLMRARSRNPFFIDQPLGEFHNFVKELGRFLS
jgi:SIR2-like protein